MRVGMEQQRRELCRETYLCNRHSHGDVVCAGWLKQGGGVFAAEQSAVIAQLPSMDDDAAPNFFEAPSAGAVHIDKDALVSAPESRRYLPVYFSIRQVMLAPNGTRITRFCTYETANGAHKMEEEDKGALSSGDDDDEGMGAGPSGQGKAAQYQLRSSKGELPQRPENMAAHSPGMLAVMEVDFMGAI
eukprot:1141822-Pelagomonas_calceolata.AAC.3